MSPFFLKLKQTISQNEHFPCPVSPRGQTKNILKIYLSLVRIRNRLDAPPPAIRDTCLIHRQPCQEEYSLKCRVND